jgi:secretion/DNA translocation related CpaE-like protein
VSRSTSLPAASHEPARPLAVTSDAALLDELVRLAAAAGTELDVVPDLGAGLSGWASAPLVLVGADATCAGSSPSAPRRDGVLLVGRAEDAAEVWRQAVAVQATDVLVLPGAEAALVDRLADVAEGASNDAPCLAVIGGRGGAGATVLAAGLAVTASRAGRKTTLIDADPLGGGIDLALGVEQVAGLRWPDLADARGRLRGTSLLGALPRLEELAVLSWDRSEAAAVSADAMASVLAAACRGADLVVVDVPRYPNAAADVALRRATATLLVVPAEVRAVAAASRVAAAVALRCADVQVAVRGPAPSRLDAAAVADAVGLPLAGPLLRPEPGLAVAAERGEPPVRRRRGPLTEFCTQLLERMPPARATAA